MRLWLIRHGETQANVDGLYSGHAPTPLTARGIEQAQNLHTLLDLSLIHISSRSSIPQEEERSKKRVPKYILGDECEGKQHSLRISIGVESANNIFFDSMSI